MQAPCSVLCSNAQSCLRHACQEATCTVVWCARVAVFDSSTFQQLHRLQLECSLLAVKQTYLFPHCSLNCSVQLDSTLAVLF